MDDHHSRGGLDILGAVVLMETITVNTKSRVEMVDITSQVLSIVNASGVTEGAVILQSMHTTAGITVNENADPDVPRDIAMTLGKIVPDNLPYRHAEGNSPGHVKTSLVGPSVAIIITGGRLNLGTWQGVFFCEFDGPRSARKIAVQIVRAG